MKQNAKRLNELLFIPTIGLFVVAY